MDNHFDYVTATIEEEKDRLEKFIKYLEDGNDINNELTETKERYDNVCLYINAKIKYTNLSNSINKERGRLKDLNKLKDEYELDNMLLEETLLSKFHEDTHNTYRNIVYDDIKSLNDDIRDILYLIFTKENNYTELVIKRNKLKDKLDKNKFPNTYMTLNSQDLLIKKQESIQNEIFILENNLKIEEEKLKNIESSILTVPILKILYEFWIIDSYDIDKVDKDKIFSDNRKLLNIPNMLYFNQEDNDVSLSEEDIVKPSIPVQEQIIPDLNLPEFNDSDFIALNSKNYINKEN